jgi:hypothetical protein
MIYLKQPQASGALLVKLAECLLRSTSPRSVYLGHLGHSVSAFACWHHLLRLHRALGLGLLGPCIPQLLGGLGVGFEQRGLRAVLITPRCWARSLGGSWLSWCSRCSVFSAWVRLEFSIGESLGLVPGVFGVDSLLKLHNFGRRAARLEPLVVRGAAVAARQA